MATSKKAAVKKAASKDKPVAPKKAAVRKAAAKVQMPPTDFHEQMINDMSENGYVVDLARKILKVPNIVEAEITAVIKVALANYYASVMDGQGIIRNHYEKGDYDAIVRILQAQFN